MPTPAFTISHRTIAGTMDDPIDTVKPDTFGMTIATITSVRTHGSGSSLRAMLGLASDDGAVAVAMVDADRIQQTPDFLRTPGVRVRVSCTVRRISGCPPVLAVIGIAPAPTA